MSNHEHTADDSVPGVAALGQKTKSQRVESMSSPETHLGPYELDTVIQGDCIELMRALPDGCVSAVVTDPPYGISFMNKGWDNQVPGVEVWREALRVLKPGGWLLAFAGTRTQHRMACAIEDAGFEIRDLIAWLYGSGFPKSLNLSGAWEGWGTALKPALEPITVARKPFAGTVAANVLEHGTGALNIDGCRVGSELRINPPATNKPSGVALNMSVAGMPTDAQPQETTGRWPANVIHDGSDDALKAFAPAGYTIFFRGQRDRSGGIWKTGGDHDAGVQVGHADEGSVARFFYVPKPDVRERDAGLDGMPSHNGGSYEFRQDGSLDGNIPQGRKNIHPTVKPVDLMRYLVRLVTPPRGIVLDPFAGSGSTLIGAQIEGISSLGFELDETYTEIANRRITGGAQIGLGIAV